MSDVNNQQHLEVPGNSGEMTQDQMVSMLLGGELPSVEGDTVAKTMESGKPEAVPEPEPKPEPAPEPKPEPEAKPEPTIIAKDGVHTIEYEKLVEARTESKFWKQQAAELTAALEAKNAELAEKLMQAKAQDAETGGTAAQDELAKLFEDFPELKVGVEKMVEARLAALESKITETIAPVVKQTEASAKADASQAHFEAIAGVHADYETVVSSEDFNKWIGAQPSFVRDQYLAVCENGTAPQVVEMLTAFKGSRPTVTAEPPASKPDLASKAQEVVAKAKATPPNSLSDIPAGAAAHHDEAEAIREMNPLALMTKFEGKTPQQIMDLMSRVI